MRSEWETVRLGECCLKIGSGATPRGGKETYLESGSISLIRSQNVLNDGFTSSGLAFISEDQAEKLNNVTVEIKDILLNITGDSVARSCMVDENYLPARVNQHVAIIRPDPACIDPYFLRFFMISRYQQELMLGLAAAGATRNALTKGMIENFAVPCPPIEIQRKIGDFLRTIEERIVFLRQANETLEAIAQAIFRSWFVDFDPVKAKAEGREPEGMDAATAALFPSDFEDSELGPIPKGWKINSLGDLAATNTRSIGRSYPHEEIQYVDISSVSRGRLSAATRFPLSEAPSRAKRLVGHGDVIWSCVRPNHRSYLFIQEPPPELVVSTGFAVLTVRNVPPSFLYLHVTTDAFVDYLTARADGAAYPAVNPSVFLECKAVTPRSEILIRFESLCAPLFSKIHENEKHARSLAEIRGILLPKLISGHLRVPEAEALVESAV